MTVKLKHLWSTKEIKLFTNIEELPYFSFISPYKVVALVTYKTLNNTWAKLMYVTVSLSASQNPRKIFIRYGYDIQDTQFEYTQIIGQ